MRQYIITITAAAVMSALAEIISPEKWRAYVRIITGLVIISCIIAPVLSFTGGGTFKGFDFEQESVSGPENTQSELVLKALKERIDADIEERLKKEFGISVSADCTLKTDSDGVFRGVGEIYLSGAVTDEAKGRLCEVYGTELQGVHDKR